MLTRSLTVGTRTSKLALWQTDYVCRMLESLVPDLRCSARPFVTRGDRTLDKPLTEIGGKGLFTLELEDALREGQIDIAVHSLKDLPVDQPSAITLGAIVGRADVRDVLVAVGNKTLQTLAGGARIGTSSLRRQAQLLAHRSDLEVRPIRGNVETRIRKVMDGEYDGAILAGAGVSRLSLEEHISQWLPLDIMLPAPGQGALAVQCRFSDSETLALLAAIDNQTVRAAVTSERSFLNALGGGCSAPVAALANRDGDRLHLTGFVASTDGTRHVRVEGYGSMLEPQALGAQLAERAIKQGAQDLLGHV